MSAPVIQVERLVKRYGATVAVNGIDFTVERGVTAALLGGNGAGKTTTLSILLGLLLPTSGAVRVFGEDVLRHRYRVLPRMNFSSPYVDLPHRLTVRQNLQIYARLYGLPRRAECIARLAGDLQIEPLLDRPAGKLSAGQKTRVALAKALLNEPELLLLDEPTAGLDPEQRVAFRALLRELSQRATVVVSTHLVEDVGAVCATVALMNSGKIVFNGTPAELTARGEGSDAVGDAPLERGYGAVLAAARSLTQVRS